MSTDLVPGVPLGERPATGPRVTDSLTLVIVRRGATERFAQIQQSVLGTSAAVIWDRREADRRRPPRRTGPNRRKASDELAEQESADRRQAPRRSGIDRRRMTRRAAAPATWTALDFVMVRGEPEPTAS